MGEVQRCSPHTQKVRPRNIALPPALAVDLVDHLLLAHSHAVLHTADLQPLDLLHKAVFDNVEREPQLVRVELQLDLRIRLAPHVHEERVFAVLRDAREFADFAHVQLHPRVLRGPLQVEKDFGVGFVVVPQRVACPERPALEPDLSAGAVDMPKLALGGKAWRVGDSLDQRGLGNVEFLCSNIDWIFEILLERLVRNVDWEISRNRGLVFSWNIEWSYFDVDCVLVLF